MESFGQAKSEMQNKFEGGVSFNVNWYDLAGQARRQMMKEINPRSAKRRVPVFGGISTELPIYTCPDDVSAPASFYPTTEMFSGRGMKHAAPKAFYENPDSNKFTIDYINGVPFIVARAQHGMSTTIVDMVDPADFSGVSLTATSKNFISGSGALYGTFTDAAYGVTYAYGESQTFDEYAQGVVVVPFDVDDVTKVEYVAVRLRSDSSNYFELKSTIAGLATEYFDKWSLARLDMEKRISTGAPDLANINSIVIQVKMNTGESQTVTLDKVQIHQTQAAFFEYYSTKIFKGADGNFKLKPNDDTDIVLLQEEEYDIWFYEMCNLLVQDATYDGIDSKESLRFDDRLAKAYEKYHMRFPSMEEPMTYNISSEIDLESTYDN